MKINMWFLYSDNGFKNHAKDSKKVPLIIYSYDEGEEEATEFYHRDFNWQLILSNNNCWIWKTEHQELIEIPIKNLILMPKSRYIRYKYFCSIEKKYLKNPYTLEAIIECLEFSNETIKKKTQATLKSYGTINFYITKWIQNRLG